MFPLIDSPTTTQSTEQSTEVNDMEHNTNQSHEQAQFHILKEKQKYKQTYQTT